MTAQPLSSYRGILAESIVFRRLPAPELDQVMASCRLVEAPAGQLLLSEGRPGGGLYVILEGEVEFFLPERGLPDGRRPSRIRLNVLGPGRCFGEYGLIDDRPSSASVRTATAARLCLLPRAEFRRLVDQSDRIGKTVFENLLRFLVERLRSKDQELDVILLVEPGADG